MADDLPLDRHAMKDRSTAHLRIFVGGITEKVTADQMLEHFSHYGRVMGVVVARGFGFVQFEEESQAQAAIDQAHNSVLAGKTIQVKTAVTGEKKPEVFVKEQDIPPAVALSDNNIPMDDNNYDDNNYGDNNDGGDYGYEEENYEDQQHQQSWGGRGGYQGSQGRAERPRHRTRSRPGLGSGNFRDRSPVNRSMGGGRYGAPASIKDSFRPTTIPDKNDCEIIVVSKALTEYAEYIEGRLKRLGIVVDLLFPMEDVPIGKVLGNIASRGCLYAILVMPENQEHRSITLTILHGVTQEHRNMPLEDALQLLMRNFQDYRRGVSSDGREAVMGMLGQLADGKSLTALQYDKVIKYLQEKREQQVKIELGEPVTNVDPTKLDLQNRILSILNDKKTQQEPTLQPTNTQPKPKLLNDPSVKKALDSLLHKLV